MDSFWKKWTLACASGELIGIGVAGLIAYAYNQYFGEPLSFIEKISNLSAMLFAGAIEGSILGYFQWQVLRKKLHALKAKYWVGFTAIIAITGWFLGMLPTLFLFSSASTNTPPPVEPPQIVILLFGAFMGLILGAFFGSGQWFVLRHFSTKAKIWIKANALGWMAGMFWIFLGASIPTAESGKYFIIACAATGGILAGISLGLVTGFYLKKILD